MQEHHFKVVAPFETVAEALHANSCVNLVEESDLHCLCTLGGAAAVIARPAYPDAVDVVIAEPDGDTVALQFADWLGGLLACDVSIPRPFEAA